MSDIFLSYSSKDRKRIRPLEKALEAQGWTVFWDRDIPIGKTWRSFIGQEIQNCLCMVVVWTENSVESEWVIEEAEEGKNRGILFPVSLDNTRPPFGFGSIQSADLTGWNGDSDHAGYQLLIAELKNNTGQIKRKEPQQEVNLKQQKITEIEGARIKAIEANHLNAHKEILRLEKGKILAVQDLELLTSEIKLTTERRIEQVKVAEIRSAELIAIAKMKTKISKAMIEADLEASRTRTLAEAEKGAEVLREMTISTRNRVDAKK